MRLCSVVLARETPGAGSHLIQYKRLKLNTRRKAFKLLEDPTVSEEDKLKIRDLLKKPWNPYVRRHTAATEISKSLKHRSHRSVYGLVTFGQHTPEVSALLCR